MADRQRLLHVDEMLDDMTPAEMVEWKAARDVLPLDDGWRQAGTIAAAAHNDFERYLAMKAGRRLVDAARLRTPDQYIPGRGNPTQQLNEASIDAHQAAIESRYGKAVSD